jgi:hypothetical protein
MIINNKKRHVDPTSPNEDQSNLVLKDFDFLELAKCAGVGSAAWDPGAILDGDEEAKEITVTGAALGDFVICSFSLDVADLVLRGAVTAANTVTAVLANNTGGTIDLAAGTVSALVIKASAS